MDLSKIYPRTQTAREKITITKKLGPNGVPEIRKEIGFFRPHDGQAESFLFTLRPQPVHFKAIMHSKFYQELHPAKWH